MVLSCLEIWLSKTIQKQFKLKLNSSCAIFELCDSATWLKLSETPNHVCKIGKWTKPAGLSWGSTRPIYIIYICKQQMFNKDMFFLWNPGGREGGDLPLRRLAEQCTDHKSSPEMGNCLRSFLSRISDDTLEQKVRRAQRVSLILLLPIGIYNHGKDSEDNVQECVTCLMDLVPGNTIRCLPCAHLFHVD